MIEIQLPNTTGNDGYKTNCIQLYEKWFEENNIKFDIIYDAWGKNNRILLTENDALLFRLRFGV